MLNNKHVFWEALIVAIFIFGIGILLGIFLENSRVEKINILYQNSELNLLEINIQNDIINMNLSDCNDLVKNNIEFGDKIYEYAKILEKYEESSTITDTLIKEHKKYDLLRTRFWINSINIREKCNNPFHNVVYFYDYNSDNIVENAKQAVFAEYLRTLKEKNGGRIMLIPIAKNMGLSSINSLIKKYNVEGSFILVDENLVVNNVDNLNLIDKYLSIS